jgi:hypothetical protein
MNNSGRYLRWLTYVAVITVFTVLALATIGKAAILVYQHLV